MQRETQKDLGCIGTGILTARKGRGRKPRTKTGLSYVMSHHKFRHAYASDTLTATGDLRLVQSALGHKDIHTTTIYTQVQTSRIHDVQALRKSTK
ncbi:MAG: tyrosine-type recombinase/integrase [Desulfocapsaceae bacterium]|nr:tyrosine-type recombinase/integrase [Desulfocapsaceae bacterium]